LPPPLFFIPQQTLEKNIRRAMTGPSSSSCNKFCQKSTRGAIAAPHLLPCILYFYPTINIWHLIFLFMYFVNFIKNVPWGIGYTNLN
jgi:hypothetical protein